MAAKRVILRRWIPGDLLEILEYLSDHRPNAADRFRVAVRETFELLARHPGLGSLKKYRGRKLAGVRSWYVKGFRESLVLYEPVSDGIVVLAIMHGSRDIAAHLRKRGSR